MSLSIEENQNSVIVKYTNASSRTFEHKIPIDDDFYVKHCEGKLNILLDRIKEHTLVEFDDSIHIYVHDPVPIHYKLIENGTISKREDPFPSLSREDSYVDNRQISRQLNCLEKVVLDLKFENVALQRQIKFQNEFIKDELKRFLIGHQEIEAQKNEISKMQFDYVIKSFNKVEELGTKVDKMNTTLEDVVRKQNEFDAVLKPLKENTDVLQDQFKRARSTIHQVKADLEKLNSSIDALRIGEVKTTVQNLDIFKDAIDLLSNDLKSLKEFLEKANSTEKDDSRIIKGTVRNIKNEIDKIFPIFEKVTQLITSQGDRFSQTNATLEEFYEKFQQNFPNNVNPPLLSYREFLEESY